MNMINSKQQEFTNGTRKEMLAEGDYGARRTHSGNASQMKSNFARHFNRTINQGFVGLASKHKKMFLLKMLLTCLFFTTFIFPLYVIESGIMSRGDHHNHYYWLRLIESYTNNNTNRKQGSVLPTRNTKKPGNDEHLHPYSYDDIYASNGLHESYRDRRLTEFSSFGAYTNADVMEVGCRLTTVLLDPRIPEAPFDHSIWYALESVATYAPYTCVVLQTSACKLVTSSATQRSPIQTVTERIYERSLPEFRRLMERGMVRISILNHTKYNFTSCSNFFNPSNALMNIHYWKDEFINNVDSDIILVIQEDAVLCHHFDVNLWDDLAFVGGIWPPKWSYKFGWCQQLTVLWRALTLKKRLRLMRERNPESKTVSILQNLCTNGYGPTGNGGLSLRNRNWMIRGMYTYSSCLVPECSLFVTRLFWINSHHILLHNMEYA